MFAEVRLDPLIAEAKERARRRRGLLAGLLLVAAVALAFGLRSGGGPGAVWHNVFGGSGRDWQQESSLAWVQRAVRIAGTFLRDSHPTVTGIETVRLATGTLVDVIRLRGHFSYTPTCVPVPPGSPHPCSPPPRFDTAQIEVDATTHKLIAEDIPTPRS